MQITVCVCIDTYGGSMGSYIYIYKYTLVLPSIVMQYSALVSLSLSLVCYSMYIDFIHQLKQELTCDNDSYGRHEADLYS